MPSVDLIIKNLKTLFEVSSDAELSKLLDIPHSTLTTWRKRNFIDIFKIYPLIRNFNINDIFEENIAEISNYEITKVFEPSVDYKKDLSTDFENLQITITIQKKKD